MAPANPELRELVKEMNRSVLAGGFKNSTDEKLTAEGEIFPSAVVPVTAMNRIGEERVFPMKWGFSQGGKLLINARVETAAKKPTFREAWENHRCIICASWYYEWEHDEKKRPTQKYFLRTDNTGLIRLAGLYRMEDGLPAFVILTRPASRNLIWMHDRMPLLLPPDAAKEWIRPTSDPEAVAKQCITNIIWQQAG